MLIYYQQEKKERNIIFLSKILILSKKDTLEKNIFCPYCLQAFSTEEILKRHIKIGFKTNGKQRIIMPKKGKYVKFKNS